MKGKFNLKEKFEKVNPENCFISEITLAELKFGVENSEQKEKKSKGIGELFIRHKNHSDISRTRFICKGESTIEKTGNRNRRL